MISLIIVSHNRQLAEGVRLLAMQMTQDDVQIGATGGIIGNDGREEMGTDALQIAAQIQEHWSEEGVLIFVDLGSAILSAETAIELLPTEMQSHCLISNAPLVEGAVVAALEASLGRSLHEVNLTAEEASGLEKVGRS